LDDARNGNAAALKSMIDAGLPVNLADTKGQCLLMIATYNGQIDTTKMLRLAGAGVDRRNNRGQLLVEAGADVNANNGNGMTRMART
jgi:ankyrin repeat protein